MSQEKVLQILQDLGGEATQSQIKSEAKKQYQDRTLSNYINRRLRSMEQNGIVEQTSTSDSTTWSTTADDSNYKQRESELSQIGSDKILHKLSTYDISITNVVGQFDISMEFDLIELDTVLPNGVYHSETHSQMIYRPDSGEQTTLLVPSTGRITVVGANSEEELRSGVDEFVKSLRENNYKIDSPHSIRVNNIIANTDIGHEVELKRLHDDLGTKRSEYDPEEFPGLIYREPMLPTITLFRTGKMTISGGKSYRHIIESYETFSEQIGVLFEDE